MAASQSRKGGIEVRSIDYVPLNERHGKVWHLGPLWFMSNAQIATLAVGLISISEGASLFWSVVAIVVGVLVGTLFMAFHSAQGPQLGLPQMIQSRPQFGYVGALLVWLFAYVQYAGFNVFNTILGGEAMSRTAHGTVKLWVVILTVVALIVALIGYDLIHKAEQWLTYLMIVIFGIFTITFFTLPARTSTWARRRARLAVRLRPLRLGLLPVHAAGRDRAQDLLLDLLGISDRRRLDDDRRLGPGRLGGLELRRHRHRGT